MVISHSFRYAFFAVPKTATQSISRALTKDFDGMYYGNYHNVVIPEECLSYYTICSVRHPYNRAISLYHFAKRIPRHRCYEFVKNLSFEDWLEWMVDTDKSPKFHATAQEFTRDKTTSDLEIEFFLRSVGIYNGRDLNQTEFLAFALALNYLEKIDAIIRFERLESDFAKLPFVNRQYQLPHINRNPEKVQWQTLLNSKTEALIYRWAEPDFLNFGYERVKF